MVYEPKPPQSSVMMLFFSEILVTLKKIYLNKHFSSGDIQNIAHEGPKCQQYPALRYFSNVILIANFVTAHLFISNTFIKYTFIKYQYLFNDNKKYLQHKMLNALSFISP